VRGCAWPNKSSRAAVGFSPSLCPTPRQELFWKRAGFPMGAPGLGYLAITTMSSTGTYPDFQVDLHGSCVPCLQRRFLACAPLLLRCSNPVSNRCLAHSLSPEPCCSPMHFVVAVEHR
jgi:hypothetical protein